MEAHYHLMNYLEKVAQAVAATMPAFGSSFDPMGRAADPRFGDFQLNGVLPVAKQLGKNPRELATLFAEKLSEALPVGQWEIHVAGPGFINAKLTPAALMNWLLKFNSLPALHAAAEGNLHGKLYVIDYSSPNSAKQMHVGHLRSMVIGEAIQRLIRFHGATVVRDNHLGDWGTQFGILLMQIRDEGYDLDAPHSDPLEDLEALYKRGSARFKEDSAVQEKARAQLVQLQDGDPASLRLWERINAVSYAAFEAIYQAFGVTFDQVHGESFYRDQVDRVYQELKDQGIAEQSQGAWVVFHKEHTRFSEMPFIIRKADGASNYASTDLATALHHSEHLQADVLVYVTDGRQQDHFQQLFLTVKRWFSACRYKLPHMEHAWFGTVLGEDGKAIKTRSGEPIRLKELVAEAQTRAYDLVTSKVPDFPEVERREIARVVGIGALRYADLAQNRTSDYLFSWDKMLAFEGNTAPYLLYAIARLHSIFRKANLQPGEGEAAASLLETPQELALASKLIHFPLALETTLADLRPHHLCLYLYELAGLFSSFYTADKVMGEAAAIQARRLVLCARTLLILETGLHLLGMETLKRM